MTLPATSRVCPPRLGIANSQIFLDSLFSAERRTQSFLIRLPKAESLPPTMASISRDGALSEFQHVVTPLPTEKAVPSPEAGGATARVRALTESPSVQTKNQPSRGVIVALAAALIAIIVVIILLYRALNPPTGTLFPHVPTAGG